MQSHDPFANELLQIDEGTSADGVNQSHVDVRPELLNGGGIVHGGVTFSLIDQSMGDALMSLGGDWAANTTVELKINYLLPISDGRIDCESRVLRAGRRIGVVEADVHNDGRLVAKAIGTYAFIKR